MSHHYFGRKTYSRADIKAQNLEYSAVVEELKNGRFYSSEGPEIKEMYFEDNKIYVITSEAARIVMTTANRKYRVVTAEIAGDTVNSACFDISDACGDYVRFTVTDANGKEACTKQIKAILYGQR